MPRKTKNSADPVVSAQGQAAAPAHIAKHRTPRAKSSQVTHETVEQSNNSVSSSSISALSEAVSETPRTIDQDAVARLAYSYWEARGFQGGSSEEDWLRAE